MPEATTPPGRGPRSSGPKTPSGKTRSSLNALKHGRYAAKHPALLPIENDEAFLGILRDHLAHFSPSSPVECRIVQQLAHTEWSLFRLQAVEAAFLDRIYQNQDSARFGQAPVSSPPERLSLALESSVNSSNIASYLANRISRLTTDRNRLILTLRSSRRPAPSPETPLDSPQTPFAPPQLTDSITEEPK